MRHPFIHHAFVNWLETAGSRLAVGVRVTGRTGQHIELSFDDITPALGAFLSSRELTVFVDWEGQNGIRPWASM
jgi:predicted N-acyltransferase